jgi:hypothetical protein
LGGDTRFSFTEDGATAAAFAVGCRHGQPERNAAIRAAWSKVRRRVR